MSQKDAQQLAIKRATEELLTFDLPERLTHLGFQKPNEDQLSLKILGNTATLNLCDLTLTAQKPIKPADHILLLHYLQKNTPAKDTTEQVNFRNFPGGQFYLQPYRSRSIKPLIGRIKNDLDLLRNNLDRFDWQEVQLADLAAKIHVFANVHATLIYHLGDEEFPPEADILFDASLKHIFCAEDAAVIAGRICTGLL